MNIQKPTGWTRTGLLVLLGCLIYLAVVTADYFCMKNKVYSLQTGLTVLFALCVITFALTLTALFKPKT